MALEGSIKDFGLAEIFQLISLQKKTGILTVHRGDTSIVVSFSNGQIVSASSATLKETEMIGNLLIRKGKITERELNEVLQIQERTKEKIGHILVTSGYISKDELKEVLQLQVKDKIFQILRWMEGWYRFDIQEIEYEKEYQVPIPTDAVLMEGVRMLDEWPYIESIIPSGDIVFTQCYREDTIETLFSSLSPEEVTIFNSIDGKRSVKEIVDLTQLHEFEVYKILATLHVSGLISRISTSPSAEMDVIHSDYKDKKRFWTAMEIAMSIFIISFILLLLPVRELAGIDKFISVSRTLHNKSAEEELIHLHKAIRYYYLEKGYFPESIESLYKERYLKKGYITDPWGSLFVYERYSDHYPPIDASQSYRLYSPGADKRTGTADDIY